MARVTIFNCDRCGNKVEGGKKPVEANLVVTAPPAMVTRRKLELCFTCAEILAAFHRTFLEGTPAAVVRD